MRHPRNLPSPWSGYFVDEIEFGGDYSFAQKLVRLPKVIYSMEARARLGQLIDTIRPDICHAHNVYHHLSPSILGLLKARGIPTVMTLHDLKLACPAYNMLASDGVCERCRGGKLHNVLVHRCIKGSAALSAVVFAEAVVHRLLRTYERCVDRFIVPSQFYLDKLCEWGFDRSRFVHIPNFVDTGTYREDFTPGRSFVYVGRLSREKGIATLIEATSQSRCALTVVGTGPQREELQRLAEARGANVTFTGFLSGEELHATMRNARAMVLPSECYENAPMSILEAYALGTPCIGARIGGVPELIREGETGYCFEPGDAAGLAATMDRIASAPDQDVEQMGRRARRWVEEDFSAATYQARVLDLYRQWGPM
jgi:glycosyltransferase involved in cell wall biosynthesis